MKTSPRPQTQPVCEIADDRRHRVAAPHAPRDDYEFARAAIGLLHEATEDLTPRLAKLHTAVVHDANGDTIDGTFTTRGSPTNTPQTGSWRVKRTAR